MSFQPALDGGFERIELALSSRLTTRRVRLALRPLRDGLLVDAQLAANLREAQATLLVIEPDLTIKLIGDHGCCCPSVSNIWRRIALRGNAWPVGGAGSSLADAGWRLNT